MSAILDAFGIDWRLLIVNTVNFALLLWALWYFLYGPLTRIIEERRKKVAQGVQDAEEARAQLLEIESAKAGMLAEAGKQADDLLARTRKTATEKKREIIASGETSALRIVQEAEAQAEELKKRALHETKDEVARLIVLGVEKTLSGQKQK